MWAVLYVVLACAYIVPGLYLWRYATAIRRLNTNCSTAGLEDALEQQKSFWRFAGILTLVSIVVALIILGVALVIVGLHVVTAAGK